MKMFKKSLFLVLTLFLAVITLASCGGGEDIASELEEAAKKIILTQDKQTDVTGDFEVTSVVKVGDNEYKVAWQSSNAVAKIGALNASTKLYTVEIDYLHNNESDTAVKLTATISKEGKSETYVKEFNFSVPKFVVNTIAEYDAAASKTPMTIHGVVTAREEYSASYKNTSLYVESIDGKGGVYAYRLSCTQEQYDNELVVGARIYVSGNKYVYSGLREFDGGCTYQLESTETQTPKNTDVTSLITEGTGVSEDYQNQLIYFNDLEIVSIGSKDDKGRYNITVGDANDAKKQFVVRINTYLTASSSDAYKAYEALNLQAGMKISVKGVCGWSNGAQIYPLAADSITVGEINQGKILSNALWTQASIPAQVYGEKEFVLGNSTLDLAAGALGDEYKNLTVEWSLPEGTTNAVLGTKTIAAVGTEGEEGYVPARTVTTLKTTTVDADKTIVLTATVKNGEEVVSADDYSVYLVKEIIANTHAEYVAAANGDSLVVKGVVTAIKSNLKEVYIQDATGGAYYLYFSSAVSKDELSGEGWCQIGNEVAVKGVKAEYNTTLELTKPEILEISSTGNTVTPLDKTEDFAANGLTTLAAADQSKLVTFTGTVKSSDTVIVGDKEISVFFSGITAPAYYQVNRSIKITGVLGLYKSSSSITYQVLVFDTDSVEDISRTDAEKAAFALEQIKAQIGTESFGQETEITLDKIYGNAVLTITGTDSVVSYNAETSVLTIVPTTTQNTTNLTIAVAVGEETASDTVAIAAVIDLSNLSATLAFTGTSSARLEANTDFDESLLGLDSTVFEVTNNGTNYIGLNTGSGGYMRVYNEKAATGNGCEMTVKVLGDTAKIKSITITFGSAKAGAFTVNGVAGSYDTATYTIDSNTFTIKNVDTSTSTANMDIKSIVIEYSLA